MTKAKWIWCKTEYEKDDYAEFYEKFAYKDGKVILKIACDGIYSAYLNGNLVSFFACSDYPDFKFFDEIDITEYCKKENEIIIRVWHIGEDSQTYIKSAAGVIFEIENDGSILAQSGVSTRSRLMNEYKNGYCKKITVQLGLTFLYDNTAIKSGYSESVEVVKTYDLHKRNIKQLVIGERTPVNIIRKNDTSAAYAPYESTNSLTAIKSPVANICMTLPTHARTPGTAK